MDWENEIATNCLGVSKSRSALSDSLLPHGLISPGQNTGVGSLSLLQGIFPTQESNPGLPHCKESPDSFTSWAAREAQLFRCNWEKNDGFDGAIPFCSLLALYGVGWEGHSG